MSIWSLEDVANAGHVMLCRYWVLRCLRRYSWRGGGLDLGQRRELGAVTSATGGVPELGEDSVLDVVQWRNGANSCIEKAKSTGQSGH